jgi:ribosome-binding protein aMBF1 (putative translation factor)
MTEGRRFDEYVEEYRASAEEAELAAFDEYTVAFRLANQILSARRHVGLTQVELASMSGIAQSEISRIERGEGNPTVETLSRVGRYLNMNLYFVGTSAVPRNT